MRFFQLCLKRYILETIFGPEDKENFISYCLAAFLHKLGYAFFFTIYQELWLGDNLNVHVNWLDLAKGRPIKKFSSKSKTNISDRISFSQNIEEYSISESSFTFSTLFDLSQIRLCGEDHLSIPIYTSCGRGRTMKSEKKRQKKKNTKKLKYNNKEM